MAKTYILEPSLFTYKYQSASGTLLANLKGTLHFQSDDDFKNSVFKIDGYPIKLNYAGLRDTNPVMYVFTEDGVIPDTEPETFAEVYSDKDGGYMISLKSSAIQAGNYTTSIYKESSNIHGLEDKNVVYEYKMLANNNIKDICLALKELRAKLRSEEGIDYAKHPENPGYSVTKDMVSVLKDLVRMGVQFPSKIDAGEIPYMPLYSVKDFTIELLEGRDSAAVINKSDWPTYEDFKKSPEDYTMTLYDSADGTKYTLSGKSDSVPGGVVYLFGDDQGNSINIAENDDGTLKFINNGILANTYAMSIFIKQPKEYANDMEEIADLIRAINVGKASV